MSLYERCVGLCVKLSTSVIYVTEYRTQPYLERFEDFVFWNFRLSVRNAFGLSLIICSEKVSYKRCLPPKM